MDNKIITDSCCDLPEKYFADISVVPMKLIVDGRTYRDGKNLSREEYYKILDSSGNSPGSASPSPADYLAEFTEAKNIFVVTISSALSSSYNNALLARKMYHQQFQNTIINVFDSLNASVGQGLIVLKLKELISRRLTAEQIKDSITDYIGDLKTFFVLEKMDNLIDSGRINSLLGRIVSILNIKLILGKNKEGEIKLLEKVRGSKKAVERMLALIGENCNNTDDRNLGIAHYRCLQKALSFKEQVKKIYNFKEIIITRMGPSIATYADEGAILISF